MSVLIKGMDMPKCCYSCPLYKVFTQSDSKCIATDTYFDRTDEDTVAKTCPLVEVPTPHGRLIDGDKAEERLFSYYSIVNRTTNKKSYRGDTLMDYEVADMIEDCVSDAPTVIESEE